MRQRDVRHAAGLTLLEVMLVMLLLGVVAGLIVATLPQRDGREQAAKLAMVMNRAAEQATVEGQVLRLEIRHNGWQLYRLQRGDGRQPAFLPGYHWQAQQQKLNHLRLPADTELRLFIRQQQVKLPAALLFSADGDTPAVSVELHTEGAASRFITWRNGQASEEEYQ